MGGQIPTSEKLCSILLVFKELNGLHSVKMIHHALKKLKCEKVSLDWKSNAHTVNRDEETILGLKPVSTE